LLEAKLKENTTVYWVDLLNDKGIPSGDIVSLEAALISEQARHRHVIEEIKEEGIGSIKVFNMTAKFSRTPAKIDAPPPRLSAHTEDILKGLGYGQKDIEALKEKGAI
jgi:crotonobetainyl-CoA:carnitine CoA-transferase CaiB-like acyl-CoA transferase